MSHFAALVVTSEFPTQEVLGKALAPYHEFECTGVNDEFIEEIDETADYREAFAEHDQDESPMSWNDFISDYNGISTVAFGETPDLDGDHKFGFALIGEDGEIYKIVDRTNPNKTWDYWRIGGRYTGKFKVINPAESAQAEPSWEWSFPQGSERQIPKLPEGFDISQKSNLDIGAMKLANVNNRHKWVEDCFQKAGMTFEEMDQALTQKHAADEEWKALDPQPRGDDYYQWLESSGYESLAKLQRPNFDLPELRVGQTLQEYIDSAPTLSAFAMVKDGRWCAEGHMGWFACVSNQVDNWQDTFMKLFDEIPDDHWLTIVDCHI